MSWDEAAGFLEGIALPFKILADITDPIVTSRQDRDERLLVWSLARNDGYVWWLGRLPAFVRSGLRGRRPRRVEHREGIRRFWKGGTAYPSTAVPTSLRSPQNSSCDYTGSKESNQAWKLLPLLARQGLGPLLCNHAYAIYPDPLITVELRMVVRGH